MDAHGEQGRKPVGAREWYDFVGLLADVLPEMHPGGQDATRMLLEMCALEATSRVLDVGCGSGSTACLIARDYGSQVCGIDLSEVMVARARERALRGGLAEQLEFRVADVFDLPFEDGWFDAVIVESVLTPLPGDKQLAMQEMVRVLRPAGRLGANEGTIDPESPPEFLALAAKHPAIHGYFTPETLRSLFEGAGLEVIGAREARAAEIPRPRMGLRGMLAFMLRVYPKLLLRLARDRQIREASKIDDELTRASKEYMGYALLVGRKPG